MKRIKTALWIGTLIIWGLGLVGVSQASTSNSSNRKVIMVIVSEQRLLALEGYLIVHEFDVITGRPGKETMHGKYTIFRKHKDYTSKTYDVEMPYTIFFSKDGKAIHGTSWATLRSYVHTYITESVGSQGCVGLTDEDASVLFDWAPVGTPVVIITEEEGE